MYTQWLDTLNFDGCETPMALDDITKFEKNNGLSINVFTMLHNGKQISPLRITNNEVRLEDMTNLLLIEGTETTHYTWIKDLDRLLCRGDDHTRKYCPFCCTSFDIRYCKTLNDHLPRCRTYDGQKTILPIPGKNIQEFTDHHKSLEHPVAIYADMDSV